MKHIPVYYGQYGTGVQKELKKILLQLNENENQVRIVMTPEQTEELIKDLREKLNKL